LNGMQGSRQTEKARQVKSKVKGMLVVCFDINGIVHKELVLADQTVNSPYYCKGLIRLRENVRRLRSELSRQKNRMLRHDNAPSHTSFSTTFWPKTTWLWFPTHHNFLFPRLKIKLKGRHFDTTEVIEAESQAVLNTLAEHDFQDAFKKGRSTGKEPTSKVIVASRPEVSFWPDGSTSPGNYGWLFVASLWAFVTSWTL
jgi:hypothetical protein